MRRKKAFTLVEVLVASSLAVVIAGALLLSTFSILGSWSNLEGAIDSLESARASMTRIVLDTRRSREIKPLSNESKLILDFEDRVISYDYYNGKVRRRVGSFSTYLTEKGRISFLKFGYPSQNLVKVEMGISRGKRILTTEAFVRN